MKRGTMAVHNVTSRACRLGMQRLVWNLSQTSLVDLYDVPIYMTTCLSPNRLTVRTAQ